jgi:hypothetical protein
MHGPDPAVAVGLGFVAHLIMNVAGPEHGLGLVLPILGSQAPGDSGLAVAQDFGVFSAHSKMLSVGLFLTCHDFNSTNIHGHLRAFSTLFAFKSRLLQA